MTDFKAKMHQIRFRLGLRPRPRWGAYSAPQTPIFWTWWAASRQGEGLGWGRAEKGGREGKEGGSGGDGKGGPQVTVEPGPLRALLRHCPPLGPSVLASSTPPTHTPKLVATALYAGRQWGRVRWKT